MDNGVPLGAEAEIPRLANCELRTVGVRFAPDARALCLRNGSAKTAA